MNWKKWFALHRVFTHAMSCHVMPCHSMPSLLNRNFNLAKKAKCPVRHLIPQIGRGKYIITIFRFLPTIVKSINWGKIDKKRRWNLTRNLHFGISNFNFLVVLGLGLVLVYKLAKIFEKFFPPKILLNKVYSFTTLYVYTLTLLYSRYSIGRLFV